ncbi:helix-turn-helix domain-containing protein [Alteribacillus bidgolensis]|uniref:XRE family transcriptional regulator, master regulator for biofilm formation n=1 Tax=Alteribacillus bidgolensis TaxID=930129 RepID=A0A1G8L4D6_9BACI|nr:helix-turn-helix domain-containing protein [Alteribacillus bidgolensis]SDI50566.1 XRE family transcriptional regulator, master regulator for biofilm formation [Alteribacillus bidgolensis]
MIGKKIRLYRRTKGMSLTELSRKANISKSYLSYIERDVKQNPSIEVLKKIAAVMDITVEELIEDSLPSIYKEEHYLDEEWLNLIQEAIDAGISKEQFKDFQEYIKYEKWSRHHKKKKKDGIKNIN